MSAFKEGTVVDIETRIAAKTVTPGRYPLRRGGVTTTHIPVYGQDGALSHEVILLTGHGIGRALARRASQPWIEITLYPQPSHGSLDPKPQEAGLYDPPQGGGWLDPLEIVDAVITAYEEGCSAPDLQCVAVTASTMEVDELSRHAVVKPVEASDVGAFEGHEDVREDTEVRGANIESDLETAVPPTTESLGRQVGARGVGLEDVSVGSEAWLPPVRLPRDWQRSYSVRGYPHSDGSLYDLVLLCDRTESRITGALVRPVHGHSVHDATARWRELRFEYRFGGDFDEPERGYDGSQDDQQTVDDLASYPFAEFGPGDAAESPLLAAAEHAVRQFLWYESRGLSEDMISTL